MPAVRSVFISDVHLGTRACQAESLLAFLREYPAQHLYLVGDIIDFWSMSRGVHWSPAQNTVIQKVLKRARRCLYQRAARAARQRRTRRPKRLASRVRLLRARLHP